jgi:hypothetical protein
MFNKTPTAGIRETGVKDHYLNLSSKSRPQLTPNPQLKTKA